VQGAFPVQPLAAPSPEQLGMLVLLQVEAGPSIVHFATPQAAQHRP
jgi:flagellar transcriptional activator FlhC